MRFLRVILVLTLLFAQYSAAQAFEGVCHCPGSMTSGKMMDCCKDKSGKASCGSCMSCAVMAPAALFQHAAAAPVSVVKDPQPALPVHSLPQRFPSPDFRPPDFPA